ncbi:hypothetical protein PanWU01x14_082720, partial [Parasponia andersonii]
MNSFFLSSTTMTRHLPGPIHSPHRRAFKTKPTSSVLPRFYVGQSHNGPIKIPLLAKFSGHGIIVRPPFSTPL